MKNRTPRKLKKKNAKKGTLIYDLVGLPIHYSIKEVLKAFDRSGIVLWASRANCNYNGVDCVNPPMVVNNLRGVKIVDLSENYSTLNKKTI